MLWFKANDNRVRFHQINGSPKMQTLKSLFPPLLLMMIGYVQAVAMLINFDVYEFRELIILACWIPLLMLAGTITDSRMLIRAAFVLFFTDGLITLVHLVLVNGPLTASSIFVFMNTNRQEAGEFIQFKSSWRYLLLIPYLWIFIRLMKSKPAPYAGDLNKVVLGCVLLGSITFIGENHVHERLIRKGIPQNAKAFISFAEEAGTYIQTKKRIRIPVHSQPNDRNAHLFVLVIGESASRRHHSLYGYHRNTNQKLLKRNDIIVYNDVISPYSGTLKSVLAMMTESDIQNQKPIDQCVSLIDVFSSAGFQTCWISNQSPIGVWDNAIFNLSHTSGQLVCVNATGNSSFECNYTTSYDEQVLQPLQNALLENSRNKLIVVHLFGSHSIYEKRYPPQFNVFKEGQTKKEKTISQFDNSIVYTDFVLDSIMNALTVYTNQHKDVAASMIYLSDHGENVYDEGDVAGHNYSGHLPDVNIEVPFLVWLSNSFKETYPDKSKNAVINTNKPFSTDQLFHAAIDLNNITCPQLIADRSPFNDHFVEMKSRLTEAGSIYTKIKQP